MNMFYMILSMVIFGSVGIVVNYIPLSAAMIAAMRALIGALVMAVAMILRRKAISRTAILHNLGWLLLSGAALGANWILLFMSYDHTGSVALSTVCYYMAPVFIMLLSPLVLREKMSGLRMVCSVVAVVGVVLISGVTLGTKGQLTGILLALGAAALYAAVVLINKVMKRMPAQETTFCQLLVAALVTLPYALFVRHDALVLTAQSLLPVLILGVVHTGLAYMLFFGAAAKLPAQSTALISYLDPLVAVVLSVLILNQTMSTWQIVGAALILGAAFVGEMFVVRKKKRR